MADDFVIHRRRRHDAETASSKAWGCIHPRSEGNRSNEGSTGLLGTASSVSTAAASGRLVSQSIERWTYEQICSC